MAIQNHPESPANAVGAARPAEAAAPVRDAASKPVAATFLSQSWFIRITLALIFALYVRAVGFAPVYDDNVISSWEGTWRDLPRFFTSDIFGSDGTTHSVYYRPLALAWGCLVYFCTHSMPGGLHLVAILTHLAVVVLAYIFGRHLLTDERLALLSALLFGLHPSKVESVAWIGSSQVDGLAGIFFFASLIAFLKWRENSAGRWMACSVVLFAAAMFTKETMVSIVFLIACYSWLTSAGTRQQVPLRPLGLRELARRTLRTLRPLLPYAVVWIAYMVIRHQVIKPPPSSAEFIHPTFTHSNVWTAPYSIWWYLRHLVMPWGLSVEYAPAVIEHPTWLGFGLPAAGIILLLAGAGWLCWRRRSTTASFLLFWFVLTLAPPVIVAPMVLQHDRYLYLPAYAFCVLVAWAILRMGNFPAKARMAAALCVVALWSGLTWHEMSYWDDDRALWSRVLQISPSHPRAQIQLAFLYKESGDIEKSLSILDNGLRYRPNSPNLWLARAGLLLDLRPDEARSAYLKVMQVTAPAPGQTVAPGILSRNRAAAAYQLALLDVTAKNFTEAECYARIALALRPEGVGYHTVLSMGLRGEGRVEEANAENLLELHLRLAQQRR